VLDRQGGEGRKVTTLPSDVDDYVWAPDGKRIALVVQDADTSKPKTSAPIVIDRFQFKQDEGGYLGKQRRHLYLLNVDSGKATILTPGDYDELLPAWSPDGKSLAFVSKRHHDADRDNNWDVYVVEAVPGATPRQLTTFDGADGDPDTESPPAWSPDGRSIAYLQGGPPNLIYYGVQQLAVVPATGGGGGAPRAFSRPRSIAMCRSPCGQPTERRSTSSSRTTAPSPWRASRPRGEGGGPWSAWYRVRGS
jgi:Tol biopolymer transport system component